jgi:hypothetical protein
LTAVEADLIPQLMHTTVIGSNKSTLTVHNRATERARGKKTRATPIFLRTSDSKVGASDGMATPTQISTA